MIVLLGVLVVVAGFALRLNPLLVVTVAGITSALTGRFEPLHVLDAFGTGFAKSRSVCLRSSFCRSSGSPSDTDLQQRAKMLISQAAALTAGRSCSSTFSFANLPPQSASRVSVAAADGAPGDLSDGRRRGDARTRPRLPARVTETIKAHAAAADTIGAFFGEDFFVAIGAVLLITAYVDATYHLKLDPLADRDLGDSDGDCGVPHPRLSAAAPRRPAGCDAAQSLDRSRDDHRRVDLLASRSVFLPRRRRDRARPLAPASAGRTPRSGRCSVFRSSTAASFRRLPPWPLGVAVIGGRSSPVSASRPGEVSTTTEAEREASARAKATCSSCRR